MDARLGWIDAIGNPPERQAQGLGRNTQKKTAKTREDLLGHRSARKIASKRGTLRRAYEPANNYVRSPNLFCVFCGRPDRPLTMRLTP
jgi:hypothetical protein